MRPQAQNNLVMAIIRCPECNNEVSTSAEVCPHCGVRISGNIKMCPDCGAVSLKEEPSCKSCGASLLNTPVIGTDNLRVENKRKKRSPIYIILLLAILAIAIAAALYYYVDINNKQRDEQEAYESVITVRDTALCNNYMERYPEGIHYNEVKELYLKLVSEAKDWNDACINGTRNGFIRFLNNHPDSGYEQVCNDKIDSLDFVAALSANTVEAYKLYLDNHPKGLYNDQALQAQEKIDELTVKPEEEIQIEKLCETFFSSLATKNEEILLSTVDNVMDNFLNKKNATHSDIKALSEKLAEGSSNPKTFIVNNDFNIHKSYESSGDLSYNVTFSVNGINSDNQMAEKYAVNVIAGSNMKIKSLGMKRSASNDTNKGQE